MKTLLNKTHRLAAVTGTALAFLLGGNAVLQAQDPDPERMRNMMQQFQNMTPEQMDAMRENFRAMQEQFQNMDPQQRDEAMQQFQAQRDEFMNMTPQQQQERLQNFIQEGPQGMMNNIQKNAEATLRQRMEVADDEEWSLIEAKMAAVRKAKNALLPYSVGMMGPGGMGGMGGGFGRGGMSTLSTPETRALKQATDNETPDEETQNLLTKFRTAREEKQTALTTAQDQLRAILTSRQEAIVTLMGLLE